MCIKVSKSKIHCIVIMRLNCFRYSGGINEKVLLAEADCLKQIPPNDHIINYFLTFFTKGLQV